MTLIGLAFLAIWLHLARHPDLLVEGIDPANLRQSVRRSLVSPIVFGATIGLAFVNPLACFVVYALMAAYFAAGPASAALRRAPGDAEPPPPAADPDEPDPVPTPVPDAEPPTPATRTPTATSVSPDGSGPVPASDPPALQWEPGQT